MKTSNSLKLSTLLDSYAWIEFFLGSLKGEKAKNYIDSGNACTPLIVIAELSAKYAILPLNLWEERLIFIQQKTEILPFTLEIVSKAGRTRQEMRKERPQFGLADAIIYETAQFYDLAILSGDPHFKGLPDVIFLD